MKGLPYDFIDKEGYPFELGSYLVKIGRKITSKLSAKQTRRQFLEGLLEKVGNLSPLIQMSNS